MANRAESTPQIDTPTGVQNRPREEPAGSPRGELPEPAGAPGAGGATPWIEVMLTAVFPGVVLHGPTKGTWIERAAAFSVSQALRGWPEDQRSRDYWASYYREEPHDTPEAVHRHRAGLADHLRAVLRWGYSSYPRRNYALLALANLHLLGAIDAQPLKDYYKVFWATPAVRDYVRDAVLGVEGVGGAFQAFKRTDEAFQQVARARIRSPRSPRVSTRPSELVLSLKRAFKRSREKGPAVAPAPVPVPPTTPRVPAPSTTEGKVLGALRAARGRFVPGLSREAVRRLKVKSWPIESAPEAKKAGKRVKPDAKGHRLIRGN